jgi:hypothetical protein
MPAPGPTPPPALMFPEAIRRINIKKWVLDMKINTLSNRFYIRRTLRFQIFFWIYMASVVDPHWFEGKMTKYCIVLLRVGKNPSFAIKKNCNLFIPRPPRRMPTLRENPSDIKENIQHFKT